MDINSISAGDLPQTPQALGELTARFPRPPSWILGVLLLREGQEGKAKRRRGAVCVMFFGGWGRPEISPHGHF